MDDGGIVMSISLLLFPMVIALTATAAQASLNAIQQKQGTAGANQKIEPLLTTFNDTELLQKTLSEHGLIVEVLSDNAVSAKARGSNYELLYQRQSSSEAFWVSPLGWNNADALVADIACLDKEYRVNVQSYTYNKLMTNLAQSEMTIESETVLEDDSILLTINV
jgi:hypothetical protein